MVRPSKMKITVYKKNTFPSSPLNMERVIRSFYSAIAITLEPNITETEKKIRSMKILIC
jgi:hypothetical protein